MATPQRKLTENDRPSLTRNARQNKLTLVPKDTTRNVRTSSMPGSPTYQQPAMRATVSDDFSKSYQNRVLSSQLLSDTDAANDTVTPKVTREEKIEYAPAEEPTTFIETTSVAKNRVEQKPSATTTTVARVRATTTNTGILSWGLWSWAVFQLPIAIISLIFLGLAGALDAIVASAKITEADGVLVTVGKATVNVVGEVAIFAASQISSATGMDLSYFEPITFFLATYFVVLAFGIIMLMSMYIIYALRRLSPLSGQGSGLKFGMFLLAYIGYSLPFFNLFPWFVLWAAAVWKYPK